MSLEELMNVEVVSPSRYKQKLENVPASVIVVTARQIRERGYEDLSDILRDLPGFDVIDHAGRFGEFYTIRGIDGNDRFLVLIDGQKLNPASGTFLSVGNSISVLQARQVEIIYGSASAIYGADAFAGIINIISREEDSNTHFFRGSWGSRGTGSLYSESHFALPGLPGARLALAGRLFRSDGLDLDSQPALARAIRNYTAPHQPALQQPIDDYNLSARLRYGRFKLSYFRQHFSEGNALGLDPATFVYNEDNRWIVTTDLFSANYELDLQNRGLVSFTGTYSRHVQDPETQFLKLMRTDSATMDLHQYMTGKDNTFKGSLIYRNEFHRKLHLISGIDAEHIRSIPPYANDFLFPGQPLQYRGQEAQLIDDSLTIKEDRLALFAQLTFSPRNWVDVIGGVRYDYSSRYSETTNPRLAVVLKPSEDMRIKWFYGTAFQAPSLFFQFEQFGTPGIVMVPNPKLNNQEMETYTFSVSKKFKQSIYARVSLFHNNLTNLIVRELLPDTLMFFNPYFDRFTRGIQNVNIGKQTAKGVDFEMNASLNGRISGYAYYSYVDADNEQFSYELPLPRVAVHKVKLGATYQAFSHLAISPRLRWIGPLNTDPSNTFYGGEKQPGYTEVDLYLRMRDVLPHTSLFVTMENVLNKRLQHAGLFEQGAPRTPYLPEITQPGFSIRIGAESQF